MMTRKLLPKNDRHGQSSVEIAFSLLFFIAFLFVLADLSRITYHWFVLQYAVNEGARFGILGKTDAGDDTRVSSIRRRVVETAERLGVTDVNVTVTDDDGNMESAGATSRFFTLLAEKNLEVGGLTGLLQSIVGDYSGVYSIHARTAVRNEPF